MQKKNNLYLILIFITVFFLFNGMGFIAEDSLSITITGIPVSVGEILFILLIVYSILFDMRIVNLTGISTFIVILIILTLFHIIRAIINGYDLYYLIKNCRSILFYIIFFIIRNYIKSFNEIEKLIKMLIILFLLSSISTFLSSILGFKFGQNISEIGSNYYRTYSFGYSLSIVVSLLCFSIFTLSKSKNKYIYLIIFIIGIITIILSYFRTYYFSLLLGIVTIIIVSNTIEKRKRIHNITIFILLGLLLYVIISSSDIGYVFSNRFIDGLNDVIYKNGNYAIRLDALSVRYKAIMSNNPIYGIGFEWELPYSLDAKNLIYSPFSPISDSGYGSVLVIFGITGLILFILIYAYSFYKSIRLLKSENLIPLEKAISYAFIGMFPHMLVANIAKDEFTWIYAIIPYAIFLGIFQRIIEFRKLGLNKYYNNHDK